MALSTGFDNRIWYHQASGFPQKNPFVKKTGFFVTNRRNFHLGKIRSFPGRNRQ
jgi:hypothetical protein